MYGFTEVELIHKISYVAVGTTQVDEQATKLDPDTATF